jgi:hypothetical protein
MEMGNVWGGGTKVEMGRGDTREWIRKRILFTQGRGRGGVEPERRGEGQEFTKLSR